MSEEKSHPRKKILVLGDVMLDINHPCTTTRFCPEAATIPIYHVQKTEFLLGGASNVAKTLHSLGHNVSMLSVIGSDLLGKTLQGMLEECLDQQNVSLFIDIGRSTTQKYRLFRDSELVVRYDIEDTNPLNPEMEAVVLSTVLATLDSYDAVVFSDYNKGFLTEGLCRCIIQECRSKGIPTFVDPKPNGVQKYEGCFCFKPNRIEAFGISGKTDLKENGMSFANEVFRVNHEENRNDLNQVLETLQGMLKCDHVVMTAGSDGMYVDAVDQWIRPKREVLLVDETGCGDTVLAVLVDGYLRGLDLNQSAHIANWIAGKSVGTIGNYVATRSDVVEAETMISDACPILHEDQASFIRSLFPVGGPRIVFTNGCFDLIHSAHIRLLQFAKKQGDILVVAINSDESVRALKGDSRPIQPLEERCRLLQSLEIVDFIIVFSSPTPLEICSILRPDVLVKGGDYKIEDIKGREYAGSVVLYNYHAGISSTNTIQRVIKQSKIEFKSSV